MHEGGIHQGGSGYRHYGERIGVKMSKPMVAAMAPSTLGIYQKS